MADEVALDDQGGEPAGSVDTAVTVRNLSKHFGDLVAVDNVSFEIRDGEFFTILGPSGSGKSTLLRLLAGLESATSGTIEINGQDMRGVPPEKRPTNMIFQQLALFPHKNVYENLEFGLKMQKVPKERRRERADDMLDILGLSGYGNNGIEELSGGEQQRVALGRSLLTDPEILLLDEPLSSLDRKLKEEMQLELRRIHDELDSTFLYVTHDQDVALTASDRVAVINDGEVIQVGTPRELYESPVSRFVAEFIGETNLISGEIVGSEEDRYSIVTDTGLEMTIRSGASLPADRSIQLSIRPEEVILGESAPTLENTYEGVVEERIYRGDRTRYLVTIDDREILVQRSRRKDEHEFEVDEHVEIGWTVGSGYVLSEGEDGD